MLFSEKLRTRCNITLLNYCVERLLVSDLCFDHSVNSTDLTVQCSQFLFLSVDGPKISTNLEGIAQIYLPYLPLLHLCIALYSEHCADISASGSTIHSPKLHGTLNLHRACILNQDFSPLCKVY